MRSAIRPLTLATGGRRKSVRWPHSCARIATMSFATDLFADVDRKDAVLFAKYLADDAVFRFANADEVVGRDNIGRRSARSTTRSRRCATTARACTRSTTRRSC